MKKLVVIAMVAFSVVAFAQVNQNEKTVEKTEIKTFKKEKNKAGKKRGKGDFSKKFESLNLTDSQKEKIKALKTENKENLKKGEKVSKEDREIRFAEMDKQMKNILTKEQYAKFQEIQKEKLTAKASKGNRKGSKGSKFADLNLTDSQKEQLKALKGNKKVKGELAQKQKLTKEEKQTMRAEMDKKIKTILTPEQYAKFSAKKGMKQKKEIRS